VRDSAAAVVIIASMVIAACGSGSPSTSSSSGSSAADSSQTQPQRELLNFSRCMRSHGVSNFPDPNANGGGFNVAGLDPSSPAFKSAQTACKQLLPVKRPPSGPPSPQAYSRLVHWASCMRAHGISGLPDPRPNPPPSPGSQDADLYGTLMGDGGYWVGIPNSINAHSPAFTHLTTVCGESPDGHHG
jgi:hypothetical protein